MRTLPSWHEVEMYFPCLDIEDEVQYQDEYLVNFIVDNLPGATRLRYTAEPNKAAGEEARGSGYLLDVKNKAV